MSIASYIYCKRKGGRQSGQHKLGQGEHGKRPKMHAQRGFGEKQHSQYVSERREGA